MKSPIRHRSTLLFLAALLLLQAQIAFGGCMLWMGEQMGPGVQASATQAQCAGMMAPASHRLCLSKCEHSTNAPWSGLDFSGWSLLAQRADWFLRPVLLQPATAIAAVSPRPNSGPPPYLRLHRFLS